MLHLCCQLCVLICLPPPPPIPATSAPEFIPSGRPSPREPVPIPAALLGPPPAWEPQPLPISVADCLPQVGEPSTSRTTSVPKKAPPKKAKIRPATSYKNLCVPKK